MSSPDLDELSGMTYLSYFMADPSPGFQATLGWVKSKVDYLPVDNFDVSVERILQYMILNG